MTVYRTPGTRPIGEVAAQPDPFPTVECFDCGARTTSMNGEDLCAACDLKWLNRDVDWVQVEHDARVWGGPGHHYKGVRCAYCGRLRSWPWAFPHMTHAECHTCARQRLRNEERKAVAIIIARLGQLVADIVTASRGL